MKGERKRILGMLAEGKVSADEAAELIDAIEKRDSRPTTDLQAQPNKKKPKFLKIKVTPKNESGEKVNIAIPLMLVRAGAKLASIVPGDVAGKVNLKLKDYGLDVDLNKLDADSLDGVLTALCDTSIDVDDEKETVKIYCE
jgi:hypothetical protein